MMPLYRALYTAWDGHERGMTFTAPSDSAAVWVAKMWQLQDKLNSVESLRTKQQLLLEV